MMSECVFCDREEESAAPYIVCSRCVINLLEAPTRKKVALRDKLIAEGQGERARIVSLFIPRKEHHEANLQAVAHRRVVMRALGHNGKVIRGSAQH